MSGDREQRFLQMVAEFPDSPMGHFSLGKLYLDERRYPEAVAALAEAVRLDPNYAAAWVALGDAHAGAGQTVEAKEAYQRALATPLGKKDQSLLYDVEQRLADL